MTCDVCASLLHPYVDAELPLTEALSVEKHLAECERCRTDHEAIERLRAEIAAARLDYRPPRGLRWRIDSRRKWFTGLAAAAAVVLAVFALQPRGADVELFDAHLRSLAAATLVDVPSSDRHTVKPWFQGKVPFSPFVPDLAAEGFPLLGGRLDVVRERRVAAMVYKRREHVINVFVADGLSGNEKAQRQGYHLTCWQRGDLPYCAVSDLNAAELGEFARLFTSRQE